jgi:alanyl-tRNA synthetase
MQQHTGQHIISGALWKVGGHKTVSVHMGVDYTTIEIESASISEQHLLETETMANKIIAENLPVTPVHTDHPNLDKFLLRKPVTREGKVRLIRIGDFDCVGCGGLHFDRTGEVRMVKSVAVEKIRGNTRITWMIGNRAINDYREKDSIISELKPLLETREEDFIARARGILNELSEQKRKLSQLEQRLAEQLAANIRQNSAPGQRASVEIVTHCFRSEDEGLVKQVIKRLMEEDGLVLCLVNVYPGKLTWSVGCTGDAELPFDRFRKELLPMIEGRGGGRFPLWQGGGSKTGMVKEFLDAFRLLFK